MANVFLVDLEPVETRYTAQWKAHIPELLKKAGHNVQILSGPKDIPDSTTPGAFLNFGGTNIYKSLQVEGMGRLFCAGAVSAGDHFIFTDAWHPGIINLKYMSELLGIPVKIHGLWHAGSYDPHDFLGRLIGDAPWVRLAENSFFNAIDYNYFASDFHIDLLIQNLFELKDIDQAAHAKQVLVATKKIVRTGWPMEYMEQILAPYKNMPKRDLIVFPHRIAPEKQVEIFRDLAEQMPEYEFVVCQDRQLTKQEYHNILGQAKVVFSCSLQETLGIGCYEGAIVDAIPMVPDRLSYSEMYFDGFKYPSEWTIDFASYIKNRDQVKAQLTEYVENYQLSVGRIKQQADKLTAEFFSAGALLDNIQ